MIRAIFCLIIYGVTSILGNPIDLDPNVRLNLPENVAKLRTGDYSQNAEELSGQYEGDIILSSDVSTSRNGLSNRNSLWSNGQIAYELQPNAFSVLQLAMIQQALYQISVVSCVTFVPRTNQVDYVYVTGYMDGCYSYVGRIGGRQQLNLTPDNVNQGCFRFGTIVHEFLHVLGFDHMQSAPVRDEYVQVRWENVQAGMEHNFQKTSPDRWSMYGIEYDADSVLHYSMYAFSRNGQPTITPFNPETAGSMGQRDGLSAKDVHRINNMYMC